MVGGPSHPAERKVKASQVPQPASHGTQARRLGQAGLRLPEAAATLLGTSHSFWSPVRRQVVNVNAVYQAFMGWQKACFECGQSSLLFRSVKCNIQIVGKYLRGVLRQRGEDTHRSILTDGDCVFNTHCMQREGSYLFL